MTMWREQFAFAPLATLDRGEEVGRQLRYAIELGVLEDGTQLPSESELAAKMGVAKAGEASSRPVPATSSRPSVNRSWPIPLMTWATFRQRGSKRRRLSRDHILGVDLALAE